MGIEAKIRGGGLDIAPHGSCSRSQKYDGKRHLPGQHRGLERRTPRRRGAGSRRWDQVS